MNFKTLWVRYFGIMKTPVKSVLLIWIVWVLFQACLGINSSDLEMRIPQVLVWGVAALLTLAAFALCLLGPRLETRFLFFFFGVFFSFNGLLGPVYYFLLKDILLERYRLADFYYYQYSTIGYFIFLLLVVTYAVVSLVSRGSAFRTNVLSIGFTVMLSGVLFAPYFDDPMYLYSQRDAIDYFLIKEAVDELKMGGDAEPSVQNVASTITLHTRDGVKEKELTDAEKLLRVREILRIVQMEYPEVLFYRTLYQDCVIVSGICVILLFTYIVLSLVRDLPKSAFLDKIVPLLVPYTILEGFHYYAYESTFPRDRFHAIQDIGAYLSLFVMLAIVAMFVLRLRFISSVEGKYYENRILKRPDRITRWRDSIDIWLLRAFSPSRGMDGRFLVRNGTAEEVETSEMKKHSEQKGPDICRS